MTVPGTRPAGPAPGSLLAMWEGRAVEAWTERLRVATAEFHTRIASTSDRAKELAGAGRPLPAVVVADRQWRGRGRRGRRWESDTPWGLWFTFAHSGWTDGVETIPLRAGLAVARALETVAPGVRVQVKWPNDLLIGGRKVGGILCERASDAVLAGIGLNLDHHGDELPDVVPPATSLRLESGRRVGRGTILPRVLDALATVWKHPAARIPADELDALNARSALGARPLSVSGVVRDSSQGPRAVEGLAAEAVGLRADGSLEVRDRAGRRWRVIAGTVDSWS